MDEGDHVENFNLQVFTADATVTAEIVDSCSFRSMLDILCSKKVPRANIRMSKRGLRIIEHTSGGILMDFEIGDRLRLVNYNYNLYRLNGSDDPFVYGVGVEELKGATKGIVKKDSLMFSIDVMSNGTCGDMIISKQPTGCAIVKTYNTDEKHEDYVDYFAQEYEMDDPNAIVKSVKFSEMMKSYKTRQTKKIEFLLCSDGSIMAKAWSADNQCLFANNITNNNNMEQTGVYSIERPLKDLAWMAKLASTSASSAMSIYLKNGRAMCIRLPLGSQGMSTYTIAGD